MGKTKRTKHSGRPEKPEAEKAKHAISVWLTCGDKDLIRRAAKAAGDPDGRWLGKVGTRAAREALAALGLP